MQNKLKEIRKENGDFKSVIYKSIVTKSFFEVEKIAKAFCICRTHSE